MTRQKSSLSVATFMICIALGFTGCSTMTSHTDWDGNANFAGLKTYSWVPGQQPPTGNPRIDNNTLLDDRIRSTVDDVLQARGYTKTSSNPDFWVSYAAAIESKLNVTSMPTYGYSTPYYAGRYAGPVGGGYGYGGWTGGTTTITQYDEGSLIFDIADAKTKRLIWRGTVADAVDETRSPAKKEQIIDKAVTKVFAEFPPTPK